MPQYYCHQCLRSFDIQEGAPIACTRCQGEFVEAVNRPAVAAAAGPTGVQFLQQFMVAMGEGDPAGDDRPTFQQFLREQLQNIQNHLPAQAAQEAQPSAPPQPTAPSQAAPTAPPPAPSAPPQNAERRETRAAAGSDPFAANAAGTAGEREADAPSLVEFITNMFRPEVRGAGGGERAHGHNHPTLTVSFQGPGMALQVHTNRGAGGPQDADLDAAMNEILATFQNGAAGGGGDFTAQRGFTEHDISTFLPMKKVTAEQVENGTQCTTCFDIFKLDDDVAALDCNHIFHRPCIIPWLKTKNTCPMCRQKVSMSQWKKKHQKKAQEAMLEDLD